ncbi:PEP/pyruvate-binding domain-containing protein [Melioribacter sp. OK-6-Me]|uniref:PEP/pyruvate-binding domain-containing protein n=1 Tax=unclassified Melioribacter TaxID=2627329 RepID=UPI003ED87AA9
MDNVIKFNKELIEKSSFSKFQDFHNLMRYRIRDILLVSSLYDLYILEEDKRLYEYIRHEYEGLSLSHAPELVHKSSGTEAIRMALDERKFDLIITTLHIEDMSPITFARRVKEAGLDIPVVLLGHDNREMNELLATKDFLIFDKVFIWQGDYRIVLAIIKFLEDRNNVENDTKKVGVQSIILIEDNVRFYSSYLPIIYTEILKQSQNLMAEGLNLSHKYLRMRARPKILLCTTFEEGWEYFEKYEEYVLGIISDIDFKKEGIHNPNAGIEFARKVKERHSDIPILLQSTLAENEIKAREIGADFLIKNSPTLLEDLKKFMLDNFGFGEFKFKAPDGKEVGRAKNLIELEAQLKVIPDESLLYHASRNHFSNWLKARTEFWLAHRLRPQKVTDFITTDELRKSLINSLREFRKSRQVGIISDFNKESFDPSITFARIGGGSLGGKARGLGFVNRLLSDFDIRYHFKDVKIFVPSAVVIGTEVFDDFVNNNNLLNFALRSNDDSEIKKKFLNARKFSKEVVDSLKDFLSIVKSPIAVRSSSLLEDSQDQPFAGVYDTFMLPNNENSLDLRLDKLLKTIKRIYASIYLKKSKDYIRMTSYRLEEEKMAVIIQVLVGSNHNGRFYPEFSGVAKLYNYYPISPLKSSDGIVAAAPGLGKYIVDGEMPLRFSPKHPGRLIQFSSIDEMLNLTPNHFYALDINSEFNVENIDEENIIKKYPLHEALKDDTLKFTCSTYSNDNNKIYDGIERPGPKLFTLLPILKYKIFPLTDILNLLLEMGNWGTASPVEIEFAVNLSVRHGKPAEFALLQMRPMVINSEVEELDVSNYSHDTLLCKSNNVLGNGIKNDIRDIVYVNRHKFESKFTSMMAEEVEYFNNKLIGMRAPYLLIGIGRWGSLDPWLGIPVIWEQINGVGAIVESNYGHTNIIPSQGSHFFQNLTSFKVGYFSINQIDEENYVDWEWLDGLEPLEEKIYTKHIRLEKPLTIKINGQKNYGIIVKPE